MTREEIYKPKFRITFPIHFRTAQASFSAELNDTDIARAIFKGVPISSEIERWGDELYFDVPVKMKNTAPTREVKVGDIAYWPDGPSLCIFFGKTPASKTNEPRPASDVTIVGHTDAPVELLRAISKRTTVTVSR